MRVVRLDDRVWSGPAVPARSELDAQVGSGLIETMRAADGRIAFRDLHMARLEASVAACGFRDAASPGRIAAALDAVVAHAGTGDLLVRLVAGRGGGLLVEADDVDPLGAEPARVTATVLVGLWDPNDAGAGHKVTGRDRWVAAEAVATTIGADAVLAADVTGALGEASRAAIFVVTGGELWTAPLAGILPGVGRQVVIGLTGDVRVEAPGPDVWRTAEEVFLVSALRGVTAVVDIDRTPVGTGEPGPMTSQLAAAFAAYGAAS